MNQIIAFVSKYTYFKLFKVKALNKGSILLILELSGKNNCTDFCKKKKNLIKECFSFYATVMVKTVKGNLLSVMASGKREADDMEKVSDASDFTASNFRALVRVDIK